MTRKEAVYLIQRMMLMLRPDGEPISDLYEALSMALYDMGIVDQMKKERDATLSMANELMKPSAQPEQHYCRSCKWSWCHVNVDKYGSVETYWRCLNWDGETEEEGYCHEWERRTDGFDR